MIHNKFVRFKRMIKIHNNMIFVKLILSKNYHVDIFNVCTYKYLYRINKQIRASNLNNSYLQYYIINSA